MTYELPVNPPFDLELTLGLDQGHRWRRDPDDPGWYTSVIFGEFVRIRQKEQDGPLEVEYPTEELLKSLRWQFRVDEDTQAIYGKLAGDPKMKALRDRYYGLRLMRVDAWECLVFFILSAHNHYRVGVATGPSARTIDEIASAFWEDDPQPDNRYPFPSPGKMGSRAGLDKLNELWLGKRIGPNPYDLERPRLHGLKSMPVRLHLAGRFVALGGLQELWKLSTRDFVPALKKALPGVGTKTANCVALFGFGRLDAFPVDTLVTRALLSLYAREPFQPHAGYVSQLLFMEGLTIPPDEEGPFSAWLHSQ